MHPTRLKAFFTGHIVGSWIRASSCFPAGEPLASNRTYDFSSSSSELVKLHDKLLCPLFQPVSGELHNHVIVFGGYNQHGLTKGKLCLINPVAFYDKATTSINKGRSSDIIYLNLKISFFFFVSTAEGFSVIYLLDPLSPCPTQEGGWRRGRGLGRAAVVVQRSDLLIRVFGFFSLTLNQESGTYL